MCDTLGIIEIKGNRAFLAKKYDRVNILNRLNIMQSDNSSEKEKEFYLNWCNTKLKDIKIQRRVIKYWKNKNKVLDKKIEEFKQKERVIW